MEIKKAKENKGRGQEGRVDVISQLENAFSSEEDVVATVSLCLDLLPYYTPDPKIVNFELGKSDLVEYLGLIAKDVVFVVLAAFVGALKYKSKTEFSEPLRKMVGSFFKSEEILTIGDDPGFAAIKQGLAKWRPGGMDKGTAQELSERLEKVILVEYAKELDQDFCVFSYCCDC